MTKPAGQSVLFYRHFDQYSGGQQKVFDYFNHVNASPDFRSCIAFSSDSVWSESNPWYPDYQSRQVAFLPAAHDVLFLAGMDWQIYQAVGLSINKPVINLIQHVRHALPGENVHAYLSEKAIRICVSEAVSQSITDTGLINGPVFTIPNGINIEDPGLPRTNEVFISGYKNPALATELAQALRSNGFDPVCLLRQISRSDYHALLAASRTAVMLPHETEGFFLPALEAMKLCELTIVPDCKGNRGFCIDHLDTGGNCLMPEYNADSIVSACLTARKLLQDEDKLSAIRHNALVTVDEHSLDREREAFLKILNQIDDLWYNSR